MLPLTAELWHPAPGFARAFNLPECIPRYEKSGYEYELGSLVYWYDGPSIALIYQASRGYQSFVVNYRLRPYTQEEGALDLARAVRFVRKNADVYGISENDIAVMGFSAGGILAGEMLLHYDGLVNGTALNANYIPDALDTKGELDWESGRFTNKGRAEAHVISVLTEAARRTGRFFRRVW